VVRRLNAAGVPVAGIPLLPLAEGYYFTADNADRAARCYQQWVAWTRQHQLVWDGVGLDIEPDARIYLQIMHGPWGLVPMLAPRLANRARPARARAAYQELVERIRADGWQVGNYQFPLIADERQAGSTLLQGLALVDVATDREVWIWMLYSSFLPALGPGLIWAYGPQAAAIGVGTTGGGPDIPGSPQMPTLSWPELARDLRLARHFCDQILIHSLEGCVRQSFLHRLRSFEWAGVEGAPDGAWAAAGLRRSLRAAPMDQRTSPAGARHHSRLGLARLALAPHMNVPAAETGLLKGALSCGRYRKGENEPVRGERHRFRARSARQVAIEEGGDAAVRVAGGRLVVSHATLVKTISSSVMRPTAADRDEEAVRIGAQHPDRQARQPSGVIQAHNPTVATGHPVIPPRSREFAPALARRPEYQNCCGPRFRRSLSW
jgi:hypothetical protein